jgi:hypothetical protein
MPLLGFTRHAYQSWIKKHPWLSFIAVFATPFSAFLFYRFGRGPFIDFPTFYYSADAAFHHWISPYGADLQSMAGAYVQPYLYPPQSLLLFWPLTSLSYQSAGELLDIITLILFPIISILVAPKPSVIAICCVAFVYASQAFRSNLYHGQVNVVVLTAICCCWVLCRRKIASFGAGSALAAAALIKINPILFVLPLIAVGKWRTLGWMVGATLFGTAVAAAALPPEVWSGFLKTALLASQGGNIGGSISPGDPHNLSLYGANVRLFGPVQGKGYYTLMALTLIIVSTAVARRTKQSDDAFLLFLPLIVLISPVAWEHHLIYIFPVFLTIIPAAFADQRWREAVIAIALFAVCFIYKIPKIFFDDSIFTLVVFLAWILTCWHVTQIDHNRASRRARAAIRAAEIDTAPSDANRQTSFPRSSRLT